MMMTKMIMSRGKTRSDDDDDACNSNSISCNIDFLILKVTLGSMEHYKDWEASSPSKSSESSNSWNKCCCII